MDRCQATDESVIEQARRGPVVVRHASAVDSNLVHHRARRGAKTRGLLAPEGEFLELPELDLDRLQRAGRKPCSPCTSPEFTQHIPPTGSHLPVVPPETHPADGHARGGRLLSVVGCQSVGQNRQAGADTGVQTFAGARAWRACPTLGCAKDTQNRAAGLPLAGDGWWWDAVE